MRGLLRGKHFLNLISETKFQDLILNFKSYQKFDFKFSRFPPSLYIYLLLSPSQFICFVCEFILTVIIFFSSRCRKQQAGQTPPTEAFRAIPVPYRSAQHLLQARHSTFHTTCLKEHGGASVHQKLLFREVV